MERQAFFRHLWQAWSRLTLPAGVARQETGWVGGMIEPRLRSIAMRKRTLSVVLAACAILLGARGTQDAVANGDTRTLELYHAHTRESLRVTFRRDGAFDSNALSQLNHFLRDWRNDEQVAMAPQLFDIVWYAYREVGATEPIRVVSAYRSPNTNAMLARRSRAVAKNSHHTRGNAMDFHIPGVSMAKVREIGMRLQRGGVGYYPTAGSPFVHLDVGTVRSWPRMPREQLERLFPDGKTVHIPADGIPLANYQLALAEVQARGGSALDYDTVIANRGKSLWALLFGSGEEDDGGSDVVPARGRNARTAVAAAAPPPFVSSDNVMVATVQPGAVTAFAPTPRQTELRPQPGSEPAAAPAENAAAVPAPASPNPAQTAPTEVAALPLPPVRPRGLGDTAPVAADGPVPADLPLPPPRPTVLAQAPAAPAVSPAPPQVASLAPPAESLAPAPELALPPRRSAPVDVVAAAAVPPASASPAPAGELRLVAAPELALPPRRSAPVYEVASVAPVVAVPAKPPPATAAEPPSAREPAYAAVNLPLPPVRSRAGAAVPAVAADGPRPANNPRPPVPVKLAVEAGGKGDLAALIAAESARNARPSHVVNVAPPPVEREVKRGVVAMVLGKTTPATEGGGRFAGRFIRPMTARFTQAGE